MAKKYIFLVLLIFFTLFSYSQFNKTHAVFIYNFTRYIEWPEDYKSGDFIIGMFGNILIYDQLESITKSKKVANQSIVVKKFDTPENISKCHILYIALQHSDKIKEIIKKLKNSSTLIIGNQPGLAKKGAAINFVVVQNRQKFELNESNLPASLKVSTGLKKLSIIVTN